MQVFHPPQSVNGLPPENVFYVADSANTTVAEGFLVHTFYPYLFPERPINMFISIRSQGPGRDMLLGALLARGQQLWAQTPQYPARLFAQVDPRDATLMAFYQESGFEADDRIDIVQLGMPNARPAAPMGYEMGYVPLSTTADAQALCQRMNAYRLDVWSLPALQAYMRYPHFLALYMNRGSELVGEIVFTGGGQAAKLLGLYVLPKYRKLGLGKALVASGMKLLQERGVTQVQSDVMLRNVPQGMLARSCHAVNIGTACLCPGVNFG